MATSTTSPIERLRTYGSFVRFEHTLFSLPLVLAGIYSVAGPAMPLRRWLLVVIAAVGARTAALALNRLIDSRMDALNPRTQSRELPSGKMKVSEAGGLLIVSAAAYLAACAALGPWYLKVAWVPLAAFTIYPFLKRVTPLCHFGVGAALGLAPLAGYAVAHPDLAEPGVALWLAGFTLFWVSGFDVIYATLDEQFDRGHGIHSMVAWLGRPRALFVSAVLHLLAWVCLLPAAWKLRGPYSETAIAGVIATYAAITGIGALLYFEQKWAEDVNLAFFKVNVVVGFAVLAMVLVARVSGGF